MAEIFRKEEEKKLISGTNERERERERERFGVGELYIAESMEESDTREVF